MSPAIKPYAITCSALLLLAVIGLPLHAQSIGNVRADGVGHLQIKCGPGIQIFLDGNLKGISSDDVGGMILQDIPAGRHQIKAVKSGFQPQVETLEVSQGQVATLTFKPFVPKLKISESGAQQEAQVKLKVGILLMQSLPIECGITIKALGVNGIRKTKDQWKVEGIPVGSYEIIGSALGKTLTHSFDIVDGQTTELMLNFITGKVTDPAAEQRAVEAQQALKQAREHYQAGRLSQASQALAKALKLAPGNPQVKAFKSELQPLLQAQVNQLWLAVQQAQQNKDRGLAIQALRQLLQIAPNHAQAKALMEQIGDFTNTLGMKFVFIPAGSFTMGSPTSEANREDDEKQHPVRLTKPFMLAVTEVTQAQWQAIMGNNPSHFKGANRPVEKVFWQDAVTFCGILSEREGRKYRLPTEAQWEYACRAGSTGSYAGTGLLHEMGWYEANSGNQTQPVGRKLPNAWGLYDMHGNVYEWCSDRYGDYPSGHVTDPTGASSGKYRVCRGGSWYSTPRYCRSANRHGLTPDLRYRDIGFRVVCSVSLGPGLSD